MIAVVQKLYVWWTAAKGAEEEKSSFYLFFSHISGRAVYCGGEVVLSSCTASGFQHFHRKGFLRFCLWLVCVQQPQLRAFFEINPPGQTGRSRNLQSLCRKEKKKRSSYPAFPHVAMPKPQTSVYLTGILCDYTNWKQWIMVKWEEDIALFQEKC